ncbi:hypothetical protein BaRGS_00029624 [Batillaria attramentaria]|uniref:Uncharacterized protein n=1 Tax=Batillaria attramentaria TaxID=370345 RepID=A0ABD0JVM2_9CAEN
MTRDDTVWGARGVPFKRDWGQAMSSSLVLVLLDEWCIDLRAARLCSEPGQCAGGPIRPKQITSKALPAKLAISRHLAKHEYRRYDLQVQLTELRIPSF